MPGDRYIPWMHERRPCPYTYCSAILETNFIPIPPSSLGALPGQMRARRVMPRHEIDNPLLTGVCPASLLDVPFFEGEPVPPETVRVLEDRYLSDSRRLPALIQADADRKYDTVQEADLPDSQSLRGPHRMGREPVTAEDQDDWSLGGRADEDIIPLGEERRGTVPATTDGTSMGRGTGMDVGEAIGALQQAAMNGGSAWQAVQGGKDEIQKAMTELEAARTLVSGVRGNAVSDTLNAYMDCLNDALEKCSLTLGALERAHQLISSGQEYGETYINALLS